MARAIARPVKVHQKGAKTAHFVTVDAPGLDFGGWSFECTNEHSARLAVDAINYAAGSEDIAYSRKAFSEEGL